MPGDVPPPTGAPHTAIILVNWNGWRDSIGCIQSCLALVPEGTRIILCDNDSRDGSVEHILAWANGTSDFAADPASPVAIAAPRLPRGVALLDRAAAEAGADGDGAELLIVPTGGNLGFAGGNNVGLRWALAQGCDYAWLLNNDTVVPPDALAKLIAHVETDPQMGMCGSLLVDYATPATIQGVAAAMSLLTFRSRHLEEGRAVTGTSTDAARGNEIVYPIGASILCTRAFLEQIGLMEEGYFLYYEEADWVLRSRGRFTIGLALDSFVYHKLGASAGSSSDGSSARSQAFLYRSRLRAARRFAPMKLPFVALGILDEAARGLVRGRRSKAIAAARALTGRVQIPAARRA